MGCKEERRYQMICGFSNNKRKKTAWNKRKDKTITLDTQVNLPKVTQAPFIIIKNGLRSICQMHSKHDNGKNCSSGEDNDSDWKEYGGVSHCI